ncbi:MAG: family 20 glycosylhydrolase [Flavobacteriaceae bacterium]|nr:family 20 glycosylhydrolase [Flavobacteriaceae bacterium]
MKTAKIFSLGLLSICIAFFSCQQQKKKRKLNFQPTNLEAESMIPRPLEVRATNSAFPLDKFTYIQTSEHDKDFEQIAIFLQDKIQFKTGIILPVNSKETKNSESIIYFEKIEDSLFNSNEAYQLKITQDSVLIKSQSAEGAFRGIQTLRQLISEDANDTLADHRIWLIPTGTITDRPNFKYRGAMLDVSRHFFSVEDVKKYIELLAYYKINVLHLHLSDDQGWRIEIKSWPKLTEIGGSTEVGGGPGGYYSQEDYKELVAYAKKHHITIVPEIDMPGHTNAASASYPILNGNGKEAKLYIGMNVGFSTFDTRKELVYQFIEDVVREISEITPGPYFHIGGDESDATKKEDYIYFINRIEKIVQSHGKQMIGWDEIGQANVSSNSISQFWRHKDYVNTAISKNMKVIMSPAQYTYLDMKYDDQSKYGLKWAGYIPVDKGYRWHPENYEGISKDHVLGVEAPLWSETITNMDELEYLAFPRVIGYAELGWTVQENRNWEDYKKRLAKQKSFLDRMGVNYHRSPLIDW